MLCWNNKSSIVGQKVIIIRTISHHYINNGQRPLKRPLKWLELKRGMDLREEGVQGDEGGGDQC